MVWTELTSLQHARTGGKYASDLTDAEWAVLAPMMPLIRSTADLARRDPLNGHDRLPVA